MSVQQNFDWYLSNQALLISKYNGRVLVISEMQVKGDFSNEDTALEFGAKNFGLGNFIIQKCSKGESDYTQMFHSRVIFA